MIFTNRLRKDGLTLVEFLLIIAVIAMLLAILLPALKRVPEAIRRASCQSNLKQWGQVFKMYAGEWNGMYPPRDRRIVAKHADAKYVETFTDGAGLPVVYGDADIPDLQTVYPKYMNDLRTLMCPASVYAAEVFNNSCNDPQPGWMDPVLRDKINPNCVNGVAYFYTSFLCYDNDTLEATVFAQTYMLRKGGATQNLYSLDGSVKIIPYIRSMEDIDRDVPLSEFPMELQKRLRDNNVSEMFRLRAGVARFLVKDLNNAAAVARAESAVPVMFDMAGGLYKPIKRPVHVFNHIPAGPNVLYMDGHVEFVSFPGKFPATSWVTGFLCDQFPNL